MKNSPEILPQAAPSTEDWRVVTTETLSGVGGMNIFSYDISHQPAPAGEGIEMRELFPSYSEGGHSRKYLYFDTAKIEYQEVDTTGNTPDRYRSLTEKMTEEGWEPLESGLLSDEVQPDPKGSAVARFTRKKA